MRIRLTLAAVALGLTSATLPTAPAEATVAYAAKHRWQPCHFEDGSGQARCIWDARHMGNGVGTSVKIFHGGTDRMKVRTLSHHRAHTLLTRSKDFAPTR